MWTFKTAQVACKREMNTWHYMKSHIKVSMSKREHVICNNQQKKFRCSKALNKNFMVRMQFKTQDCVIHQMHDRRFKHLQRTWRSTTYSRKNICVWAKGIFSCVQDGVMESLELTMLTLLKHKYFINRQETKNVKSKMRETKLTWNDIKVISQFF